MIEKWQKTQLKKVTIKIGSGATPCGGQNSYKISGIPLIRSLNIYDLSFNYDDLAFIDDKQAKKLSNVEVLQDDVLLNITGASVCRCTSVPDELVPARVNQHVSIIRADGKGLIGEYLKYVLVSPFYKKMLYSIATTGATREALTKSDIENFEIKIPSVNYQKQIVSVLSAYDALIKNNEKRLKLSEEMAQRLYTEWFVRFQFPGHEKVKMVDSGTSFGIIPEGWEIKQLTSLAKYLSRGISPLYHEESESLVINQKCIRNKRFDLDLSRRQRKKIPLEKQISFGDILINSTGVGTLGRVAQVYEKLNDCTVDSHVTIVRPIYDEYFDYLGLAVLNEQEVFERLGVGATGQTELSRQAIGEVKFVAPPKEVASEFSRCIKPIRELAIVLQKNVKLAKQMRDILIPKIVSGKKELKNV